MHTVSDFDIFLKKTNKNFECTLFPFQNRFILIENKKYRNVVICQKMNENDKNFKINKESEIEIPITNSDSNNNFYSFWKEITEEIKMIEWPSIDRLFKQFVIVIISLVFSAFVIYSVDGVFAWGSKFLFEGKF